MTLTELVKLAHENAKDKGFWDQPPEIGTSIALIHSELSEALEAVRTGKWSYYADNTALEGVDIELADAVIRIADLCGYLCIDLEEVVKIKMAYNKTRPRKHGKAF